MVIWFGSPHEPYSGLDDDLALYRDVPEMYPDRLVTVTGMDTGRQVKRPFGKVLQERFAEITAMDRAIGTLRDYLDQQTLRQDTLLWYCGDNGVPASGRVATPFRGEKGTVYEGGIRVPGIIEWPRRIPAARVTHAHAVTSDMLPTICGLVGQPLPDRPIDGVDLQPVFDGKLTQRPSPIYFWSYVAAQDSRRELEPYIPLGLQQGTTPLVKILEGRFTRNFRNFHHPVISENDYAGPRAILDSRFKLVIHDEPGVETKRELFDLQRDQAEQHNLLDTEPAVAETLERQLRDWQRSVLASLTGADYR